MLYSVLIEVFALKLLLCTESVCHIKDLGETSINNWTDIQQTVEKRIIGGTSTTLEQYPFMVQFYNRGGLCGGSILTSKTVLTAAHCLDNNKNLAMMKIFSNPRFTFDVHAHIHEVWHFMIHERYNERAIFANDIAVIIIHDEFVFGPQVQKATIIDTDIWMKETEVLIATGWGETKIDDSPNIEGLIVISTASNSKQLHQRLRKPITFAQQMPKSFNLIIASPTCGIGIIYSNKKMSHKHWNLMPLDLINFVAITYGEGLKVSDLKMTHLHYISNKRCIEEFHFVLGPEMFCLYGHGQRDTCRGDSGGGVLWNGAVVGIVSHGRNCAQFPGIYMNVYFFNSWIRQTVQTLYKLYCDFHNIKV